MKKITLCLWLFCLSVAGFSQYRVPTPLDKIHGAMITNTVDSAYMKVTYLLMSVKDPTDAANTTFKDLQTLQIGRSVSKLFSQYLFDYIADIKQKVKKGARSLENNPYRGSYAYEVFRNYPQSGTVTVDEIGDFPMNQYFLYEEPQPQMEWKWVLQSKSDTVLGYVCQQATTRFRGRDYTAWFALDLPIPLGPWKFGGLPGLILKLEDSQKHYVWTAVGIDRLKGKEPIEFRSGVKFNKVSRTDLDKLYRRMHKDYYAYWTASGGKYFNMKEDGTAIQVFNSPKELPYNPIELE